MTLPEALVASASLASLFAIHAAWSVALLVRAQELPSIVRMNDEPLRYRGVWRMLVLAYSMAIAAFTQALIMAGLLTPDQELAVSAIFATELVLAAGWIVYLVRRYARRSL